MNIKKAIEILKLINYSIFSLLAVYLISLFLSINVPEIENITFYLKIIISIYCLVFIILKTIKDIYINIFPSYAVFLFAFIVYYYSIYLDFDFILAIKYYKNPIEIYFNSTTVFISSIFTIYFFFEYLIYRNANFKKADDFSFKFIFKWNYILVLISVSFIFVFILINKDKFSLIEIFLYSSTFLFAINPQFNKRLITLLEKSIQPLLNQNTKISFSQFGILNGVKTFAFSRQNIIGTAEFVLSDVQQRLTQKKETILNLAASMSKIWGVRYSENFLKEIENKPKNYNFTVIENCIDGIIVKDEFDSEFILGYFPFIHRFIDIKDTNDLYLLKNQFVIGKFDIYERLNQENIAIVKRLNLYGNTVLLNNEKNINFDSEVAEFDRIYNCANVEDEKYILGKLNEKAPTSIITKNKELFNKSELVFYMSDEQRYRCEGANVINLTKTAFQDIENLIVLSKKVHSRINYALLIFVILNLTLLIISLFLYTKPEIIVSLNLIISLIYMLLVKKMR